jgi:ATP-dependent Zn protease
VNRFFRSALFPLVIIAALVWLALQTLGGGGTKSEKTTLSTVQQQISACSAQCSIGEVVFNPNKRELKVVYKDNKKAYVHYPSDQSAADLQQLMANHNVNFDSKATLKSPPA